MPERVSLTGETDPNSRPKDDAEARLAAFMAGVFSDQYEALFDEMDVEQPRDPGPEFWQSWIKTMLAFMGVELAFLAQDGALNAMDVSGIGVDLDAVYDQAENWARTYAFNLVSDINENTMLGLQNQLQNFYAGSLDFDGLRTALGPRFGAVRADMIAVTETTRGFERGMDIYEDGLRQLGLVTDRRWYTMDDEKVCEICEPNHLKLRDADGWTVSGIPAHPRDRCWTDVVSVRAERSIMVPNWPRKQMNLVNRETNDATETE